MDTSADGGITTVVAVALLLAGSVSVVAVATVAVLLMSGPVYPSGTAKVVRMIRVWPAGMVPSAQGNGVVQAPVFPTKVRPLGVGSDTVTPVASLGPWFVHENRVGHVAPAMSRSPGPASEIPRSASTER